ncbi:putative leader peptide [Jatrophihabitans lederbergiae]
MSLVRDRHLCHTRIMFAVTLVARLHVDLQRVVSAACRTF